ncbi:hypothetical protein ACV33D_29680, partial [Pseudomonas aeruginosa]
WPALPLARPAGGLAGNAGPSLRAVENPFRQTVGDPRRRLVVGLGGVLTSQSVSQLRCAAVAGAANNQLERPEVADELEARGILYAPDYVINSG